MARGASDASQLLLCAFSATDATLGTAASVRLITALNAPDARPPDQHPYLFQEYLIAKRCPEGSLFTHHSRRIPLAGDVNLYALFTETISLLIRFGGESRDDRSGERFGMDLGWRGDPDVP